MTGQLTKRAGNILAATVENYIRTAQPVASNRVRKEYQFPISAATIRNTMAVLEQYGYLMHPHTSAGKIPTDKGYRTYVDRLMVVESLDADVAGQVKRNLDKLSGDLDALLQIVAAIISKLSGGVGIAITPVNLKSRLLAVRLLTVSESRLILILELDSGAVRTIVAEGERAVSETEMVTLEEILNERLCGLSLVEIQATVGDRLGGTLADDLGITALILDNSSELLTDRRQSEVHVQGLPRVLTSPEFDEQSQVVTLVSLVEDEGRLRNLFIEHRSAGATHVTIGDEHGEEELATFASISRSFYRGSAVGTLAVLAPKRVNYSQAFAVLEFLGTTMTQLMLGQD